MNTQIVEYLIEEHRSNIQLEMNQIRREEMALQNKVFRPNWFTRGMQKFGAWLIFNGERLVKRYDPPKSSCQPSGHSYAH